MKKLFQLLMCGVCWMTPVQAQITNIVTEGNLAVTHDLGCIGMNEAENQFTPPDFFAAAIDCANEQRMADAVVLIRFGVSFGWFDQSRVSDPTAKQALSVLFINMNAELSAENLEKLQALYTPLQEASSSENDAFCDALQNLGKPNYFPTYMVQHGMRAFTGSDEPDLLKDFEPDTEWQAVLAELVCV